MAAPVSPILAIWQPNWNQRGCALLLGVNLKEWCMRDYRVYILGIDGHRFVKVKGFLSDHPDDTAALNAARLLTDKHEVEVWDCARLVARLSSNGEVMSPGLVPTLVAALPDEDGRVKSEHPIPLSQVSELSRAALTENSLLLGW
jgi:hypothetical protein